MNIRQLIQLLNQPIPRELIQIKEKGKAKIPFVAWFDLCQLLDERIGLGGWSWEIKECFTTGDRLILTGKISIFGDDRTLTMEATGSEEIGKEGFGDANTNAEAKAFRRCLSKIGLGRSLWKKDMEEKKSGVDYSDKASWYSREVSRLVHLGHDFSVAKDIADKAKTLSDVSDTRHKNTEG